MAGLAGPSQASPKLCSPARNHVPLTSCTSGAPDRPCQGSGDTGDFLLSRGSFTGQRGLRPGLGAWLFGSQLAEGLSFGERSEAKLGRRSVHERQREGCEGSVG